MAVSVVSFLFSRDAQPEAWGPSLLDAGFLYRILSPTGLQIQSGLPKAPSAGWWLSLPHLVSNSSVLQLTDFLSSPSYIIVQSPTQSLEWHVWSSSSENNCHAVHRPLFSGASVYECTMGLYLVPYCQPSSPTRFLLITAIGMCHFFPVHHFGMACLAGSKVNIQHLINSVNLANTFELISFERKSNILFLQEAFNVNIAWLFWIKRKYVYIVMLILLLRWFSCWWIF